MGTNKNKDYEVVGADRVEITRKGNDFSIRSHGGEEYAFDRDSTRSSEDGTNFIFTDAPQNDIRIEDMSGSGVVEVIITPYNEDRQSRNSITVHNVTADNSDFAVHIWSSVPSGSNTLAISDGPIATKKSSRGIINFKRGYDENSKVNTYAVVLSNHSEIEMYSEQNICFAANPKTAWFETSAGFHSSMFSLERNGKLVLPADDTIKIGLNKHGGIRILNETSDIDDDSVAHGFDQVLFAGKEREKVAIPADALEEMIMGKGGTVNVGSLLDTLEMPTDMRFDASETEGPDGTRIDTPLGQALKNACVPQIS